MRVARSPELAKKMTRLSYVGSGVVLLISAYSNQFESHGRVWLTAIYVIVGLANFVAAPRAAEIGPKLAIVFEVLTGLTMLAGAFATYQSGAKHYPLAACQALAGFVYFGVALFHQAKVRQAAG